MRLLDRLMSKLGYVPAERLTEVVCGQDWSAAVCSAVCYDAEWCADHGCARYQSATATTTKPRPHIIVSADFKRGIPCS